MEKIILTDVDGVLVDWGRGFRDWVLSLGYELSEHSEHYYTIRKQLKGVSDDQANRLAQTFNNSEHAMDLDGFRDSILQVRKLVKEGWKLHTITSISDLPHVHRFRLHNLEYLFGENSIERLICLPYLGDKKEALAEYKDSNIWWIEDKWQNAVDGYNLGLRSVLMKHKYNDHEQEYPDIVRVKSWQEIYGLIND